MMESSVCAEMPAAGPPEAGLPWNDLVGRYGNTLNRRISGMLLGAGVDPRPQDVEELVQEVYCRLLDRRGRAASRFRGRRKKEVTNFLLRAARSVVLDHLRSFQAAKRGGSPALPLEAREEGVLLKLPPAPAPSPEKRLLDRERCRLFFDRCRGLVSSRTRGRDLSILHLALVEGWSSQEISEKLDGRLTASSIDSIIHRIRRRLREQGMEVVLRL